MTGGQPIDGTLTVPQIVAQVKAEGANKVVLVTDEPEKYDAMRAKLVADGVSRSIIATTSTGCSARSAR